MRLRLPWALFAVLAVSARAQDGLTPADPALKPYASAQRLVPVFGGRKINLVCMGRGSPTVILTPGMGDWSLFWSQVQPAVAKKTRVCAWDRAGDGFSDASGLAMDAQHSAADLEWLVQGAHLRPPYVMVGHSSGAYETLLFTDRHLHAVAGLVLIDPSIPHQTALLDGLSPRAAMIDQGQTAQIVGMRRTCAAKLASGAIPPDTVAAQACAEYPSFYPPGLKPFFSHFGARPDRLLARASQMAEFARSSEQVADPDRHYGDKPLIVLTATNQEPDSRLPPDVKALWPQWIAAWTRGHDAYAALSTQGSNRQVASGHEIPSEKPQAVIAAIGEVIDRTRAHP